VPPPFGRFAGVRMPIDIRTGKEIGARVILIHELDDKPCGSADCISGAQSPRTREDNAWPQLSRPELLPCASASRITTVKVTARLAAASSHMGRQLPYSKNFATHFASRGSGSNAQLKSGKSASRAPNARTSLPHRRQQPTTTCSSHDVRACRRGRRLRLNDNAAVLRGRSACR
jgi:hypothetical protein